MFIQKKTFWVQRDWKKNLNLSQDARRVMSNKNDVVWLKHLSEKLGRGIENPVELDERNQKQY